MHISLASCIVSFECTLHNLHERTFTLWMVPFTIIAFVNHYIVTTYQQHFTLDLAYSSSSFSLDTCTPYSATLTLTCLDAVYVRLGVWVLHTLVWLRFVLTQGTLGLFFWGSYTGPKHTRKLDPFLFCTFLCVLFRVKMAFCCLPRGWHFGSRQATFGLHNCTHFTFFYLSLLFPKSTLSLYWMFSVPRMA